MPAGELFAFLLEMGLHECPFLKVDAIYRVLSTPQICL